MRIAGALGVLTLFTLVGGAVGAGTIDTTGATITIGAGAPNGTLTTDANAPTALGPAAIGTFSASLPAFGGGGTGVDGDFHATSTQTLAGGTFNFATYTVDAGVTLTYSGAATILTTGDVSVLGEIVTNAASQPITIRCGGNMSMGPLSRIQVNANPGALIVDVNHAFSANGTTGSTAALLTNTGDVELVTHNGGDVTLAEARLQAFRGDVRVSSAGGISATGASLVSVNFGNEFLRAFGGDVRLAGPTRVESGTGPTGIVVEASGGVQVTGAGVSDGIVSVVPVSVAAFGGDIDLLFDAHVTIDGTGDLSLRASGGVHLAIAAVLEASGGDLSVTAYGGPVTFDSTSGHATLVASGDISITSCTGGVEMTSAYVGTVDHTTSPSGNVSIRSFAGDAGFIHAGGATITTGPSNVKSGDVSLRVFQGKIGGSSGTSAVDAFFVPTKIAVKTNAKEPQKSKLTASGTFDTGSAAVDFTQVATLDVGGAHFSIPTLTAKGKAFQYTADGIVFKVTPSKTGSSRATFTLTRTADLSTEVDPNAALRLHFVGAGIDAEGVVNLVNGAFALGKKGSLVAPSLYLVKSAATLKGAGKDSFTLTASLAAGSTPPAQPPDFALTFGDHFQVQIAGGSFVPKKGVFVFAGNASGVTTVKVDFQKGTITVQGKNMDLGSFADTAAPVLVAIDLGAESHGDRVRMGHKRTKLSY